MRKACDATYMFKNGGTCFTIRVARSSFSAQQVEENLYAGLAQAVQHVPKKWANVQGVFLKTADSVALPLFQCLPDPAVRIVTAACDVAAAAKPASPGPARKVAAGSKPVARKAPTAAAKALAPRPAAKAAAGAKPVAPGTAPKATAAKPAAPGPAPKATAAAKPAGPGPARKATAVKALAPVKQIAKKQGTGGGKGKGKAGQGRK